MLIKGVPDYSTLKRSITATHYGGAMPHVDVSYRDAETWRLLIEGRDRTADMNPEALYKSC